MDMVSFEFTSIGDHQKGQKKKIEIKIKHTPPPKKKCLFLGARARNGDFLLGSCISHKFWFSSFKLKNFLPNGTNICNSKSRSMNLI